VDVCSPAILPTPGLVEPVDHIKIISRRGSENMEGMSSTDQIRLWKVLLGFILDQAIDVM
jgi:hypothetical protein